MGDMSGLGIRGYGLWTTGDVWGGRLGLGI